MEMKDTFLNALSQGYKTWAQDEQTRDFTALVDTARQAIDAFLSSHDKIGETSMQVTSPGKWIVSVIGKSGMSVVLIRIERHNETFMLGINGFQKEESRWTRHEGLENLARAIEHAFASTEFIDFLMNNTVTGDDKHDVGD